MYGISLTEQAVFAAVRKALLGLWATFGGLPNLEVVRSNNLTQSGRLSAPTIYMARGLTVSRGSPKDTTRWDRAKQKMIYRNTQVVELEILFQAMVDEQCVHDPRVGDVLNMASRIMQTSLFISDLLESEIQVLRIDNNKHTFVTNDRDQYEAVPLLSAIFVYSQTLLTVENKVDKINAKIRNV